jgi:hypothetical protein
MYRGSASPVSQWTSTADKIPRGKTALKKLIVPQPVKKFSAFFFSTQKVVTITTFRVVSI